MRRLIPLTILTAAALASCTHTPNTAYTPLDAAHCQPPLLAARS